MRIRLFNVFVNLNDLQLVTAPKGVQGTEVSVQAPVCPLRLPHFT